MRYFKVLLIVALFFVCMVFFVQNTGVLVSKLRIKFELFGLDWISDAVPIYIFILLAFVVGALVTMLYLLLERIRQGREIKYYRQQIRKLQEEINSLRTMPLEEEGSKETPGQASS
ncbi:MAG: lipopolysaccharide assembly LapA domain-containing protein [Desulfohalobiaceae bacterium]